MNVQNMLNLINTSVDEIVMLDETDEKPMLRGKSHFNFFLVSFSQKNYFYSMSHAKKFACFFFLEVFT